MKEMTSALTQQFQDALCKAFYPKSKLEQMVYYQLEETQLDVIVRGGSLEDVSFELIKWAKSQGKLHALISGAIRANPENPELKRFQQDWQTELNSAKSKSKPKSAKPKQKKPRSVTSVNSPDRDVPVTYPNLQNLNKPTSGQPIKTSRLPNDLPYHPRNGWRIDKSITRFSARSTPCVYGNWDYGELAKIGYIVEWDIEYGFPLTTTLKYSYDDVQVCKRIMLVCDSVSAQVIPEMGNQEVVIAKANLTSTLETKHLRLECELLNYRLADAAEFLKKSLIKPPIYNIIEYIEISFKLWYKG